VRRHAPPLDALLSAPVEPLLPPQLDSTSAARVAKTGKSLMSKPYPGRRRGRIDAGARSDEEIARVTGSPWRSSRPSPAAAVIRELGVAAVRRGERRRLTHSPASDKLTDLA
jgi:hypothetical protein